MNHYKTILVCLILSGIFCSSRNNVSGTTDEVETGKGIACISGTIIDNSGGAVSEADVFLYTGDSLEQNRKIDSVKVGLRGEYAFHIDSTGYYKVKGVYSDSADREIGYIKPTVFIPPDTDPVTIEQGKMIMTSSTPPDYPVHILDRSDRNNNIYIDQPSCIKYPSVNPEDTNVIYDKLKVAKEPLTEINVDIVPLGTDTVNIPSSVWGKFMDAWDHDNDGYITVLIIPYTDIEMPFQFDWMP